MASRLVLHHESTDLQKLGWCGCIHAGRRRASANFVVLRAARRRWWAMSAGWHDQTVAAGSSGSARAPRDIGEAGTTSHRRHRDERLEMLDEAPSTTTFSLGIQVRHCHGSSQSATRYHQMATHPSASVTGCCLPMGSHLGNVVVVEL